MALTGKQKGALAVGGAVAGLLILMGMGGTPVEEEEEKDKEEPPPDDEKEPPFEEEETWPYMDRFPNPAAVEAELSALGYGGTYKQKAWQFQADARTGPMATVLGTKLSAATDEADGVVGDRTLIRLAKAQDLRRQGQWPTLISADIWVPGSTPMWPGVSGTTSFRSRLRALGYAVSDRKPEQATIAFVNHVRAFWSGDQAAQAIPANGVVNNQVLAWLQTAELTAAFKQWKAGQP